MKSLVLTCASLIPVAPVELSAAAWPNEPPGSSLVTENAFAATPFPCLRCRDAQGWTDNYNTARTVQNPLGLTSPGSPPYAIHFQEGPWQPPDTGPGNLYHSLPNLPEVYAAFYVMFSPNFGSSAGIKLNELWLPSGNVIFVVNPVNGVPRLQLYLAGSDLQNCAVPGLINGDCPRGSVNLAGNVVPSAPLAVGQWHLVEQYVKPSTALGRRDSVVRAWVDGRLVMDYRNVLDTYPGPFNEFQFANTYHGVPDQTYDIYFDHVRISDPRGSAIPPPPPPPPTTTTPPPPPAAGIGMVKDLAVIQTTSNSATLSFSQVDDGTGAPAKYIVRASDNGSLWGGASDVTQGTCAAPLQGTATSGKLNCTVEALKASTAYQFQVVAFRGTMNVDAVFGDLSNVASATTAAQRRPGDVNDDGAVNVTDVQLAVNQALGIAVCGLGDVDLNGSCDVADVQRIIVAALLP